MKSNTDSLNYLIWGLILIVFIFAIQYFFLKCYGFSLSLLIADIFATGYMRGV